MNRRCVIVGLTALLAACATADDMRARAPVFAGTTTRPSADYASCVQNGWLDSGYLAVNNIPEQAGATVSAKGQSGYELLLDVASGKVTFYSRAVFGEQKYIDVARRCL